MERLLLSLRDTGFWPFLWAGFLSFSEVIITCAFIFVIPTRVP